MEELKQLNKKQLLKILAILTLSDGHLFKHNGKPKNIRLVTSKFGKSQHELFKFLCKQIFNKNIKQREFTNKITNQQFVLSDFNYRNCISSLYSLSPEYNTTPGKNSVNEFLKKPQPTIDFIFEENDQIKWLALRTYFDFDGSISPTIKLKNKKDIKKGKLYNYFQVQLECEIKISETNPSLVNELIKLCNHLDLKAAIKKDKRNWSKISGICISEQKSVKKFLESGGPITNVKISGKSNRFKEITKKDLCKFINNLFLDKNFNFSKSFKNKKEALIYQKKLNYLLFRNKINIQRNI